MIPADDRRILIVCPRPLLPCIGAWTSPDDIYSSALVLVPDGGSFYVALDPGAWFDR